MDDLISRQAAIDAIQNEVEPFAIVKPGTTCVIGAGVKNADVIRTIEQLPPAQPEEAIPVSWIEARIKRFMTMDNAFGGLTANIMLVMLNEWKREQEGETT